MFFLLLQSPPKGATIPYRPKPQVAGPVILAGGQAYTIQGNYAVPAHADVSTMPLFPGLAPVAAGHTPLGLPPSPLLHTAGLAADPLLKNGHLQAALPPAHLAAADVSLWVQLTPSPHIHMYTSILFIIPHPTHTSLWACKMKEKLVTINTVWIIDNIEVYA